MRARKSAHGGRTMREASARGKKAATRRLGFFWPDGAPFIALPIALLDSEAFRSLPPKGIAVLVAMLRRYFDLSKNEKRDLRGVGFAFTWKHVNTPCGEGTFRRMMRAIIARGFFETPLEVQPESPGEAIRYIPSRKWQTWRDSSGNLAKHAEAKRQRRAAKKAALDAQS